MANGAWIKLSVGWDEDERVALLPPLAQLTYLKVMTRAKRQRPQGGFGSLAHLKALLPENLHRHLSTLLKSGLILEQDGRVFVDNWGKHQVDPTATERGIRFRNAHKNSFTSVVQRTETEKEKEREKEKDNSTKPKSLKQILEGVG